MLPNRSSVDSIDSGLSQCQYNQSDASSVASSFDFDLDLLPASDCEVPSLELPLPDLDYNKSNAIRNWGYFNHQVNARSLREGKDHG